MMKILILEDSAERVNKFYIMFGYDHDLVVCNNANQTIELINQFKYDIIFLDHDLGGLVYVESDKENTGYQVAKQIPNSLNDRTPVIIHSWNSAGTVRMKQALRNHKGIVEAILFGNFDKNIIA